MKPFLLRLGLFAAIQLVIVSFVLLRGNPRDEDHFYHSFHDKVQRMNQIQGPRLLLVGGSNLAFGIDCKVLEGQAHAPINLGLHAVLGIDFYLRFVAEHVRQGDIVVLCPEYELFSTDPNPVLQQSFVGHCPEYAGYFELPSAPQRSWKYEMDHQAIGTIHTWVRKAFQKREVDRGLYARTSFNEYGDIAAHRELPRQGAIDDAPIPFDLVKMQASIERVNAFAKHCQNRGAKVYFSYPPMPKERFAKSQAALAKFREFLDQNLRVAKLDTPLDHVYEADQFFDTNYHLRGDAVTLRTRRLRTSLESHRLANNATQFRTAAAGENPGR